MITDTQLRWEVERIAGEAARKVESQLYQKADKSEIERLQVTNRELWSEVECLRNEVRELRALAEQQGVRE